MRFTWKTLLAAVPLMGLVLPLASCEDEPPPPRRVIVREYEVEPGYYYDTEYYDTYGYYHPRAYFYFDGRNYDRREFVPRGYHVRARPQNAQALSGYQMVFDRVAARIECGAVRSFPEAEVPVSNQACRTSAAREVREVAVALEHQGRVQIQLSQAAERAQLLEAQPGGQMPMAQRDDFIEVRVIPQNVARLPGAEEDQVGSRKSSAQRPHQRSHHQGVADGAGAKDQDPRRATRRVPRGNRLAAFDEFSLHAMDQGQSAPGKP